MPNVPFSLLLQLYPAPEMATLVSAERAVRGWVAFEHALANAQSQAGIIADSDAAAICSVDADNIDHDALWSASRNVGYPLLPLIRQIAAHLPDGPNGRVHYGATTQDAMDTGQALMLRDATDLLGSQLDSVGDRLAGHVEAHAATVMPGRTHGQQAVPTTLGAHLAPVLAELSRSRARLRTVREEAAVLSLFGAGGTSAALGTETVEVRRAMAAELALHPVNIPWHTARDRVVAVGQACVLLVGSCAHLARNVIDLSRTEIGELHEAAGTHRGASSTMPQKTNPILAEGIIGMSAVVSPLVAALGRALEVPQERAAGEWQIEWHVLPQVLQLTASTLTATDELLEGLRVDSDAMRANLTTDGGLIMAEATMISLADQLGRERAHDIAYAAAQEARASGVDLRAAVRERLDAEGLGEDVRVPDPTEYLGETRLVCEASVATWSDRGERLP